MCLERQCIAWSIIRMISSKCSYFKENRNLFHKYIISVSMLTFIFLTLSSFLPVLLVTKKIRWISRRGKSLGNTVQSWYRDLVRSFLFSHKLYMLNKVLSSRDCFLVVMNILKFLFKKIFNFQAYIQSFIP